MRDEASATAGDPHDPAGLPTADADSVAVSGVLKWFDATRGFGFIVADDPAMGDILLHFSVLQAFGRRTLPEGARVSGTAVQGQRGWQGSAPAGCIRRAGAVQPRPPEKKRTLHEIFS